MTYIAVYPASPKVRIGKYDINMVENLRNFKKALVQSLNDVLSGNKRAIVIRIAHVGKRKGQPLGYCKGIFSKRQECIFVPITGDDNYSEVEYEGVSNEHNKRWKYGYHADPLIFAKKPNGELVRSITYGENDVEPMIAWIDLWKKKEADVSKIDAYVLFNSTLRMFDYKKKFQVIHGGFKAEIWGDISCFKDSKGQCPKFDFRSVADRVEVNPHWLRKNENSGILMMVDDSERWFFSMPIAPPPLYFLAQEKEEKIEASKKLIQDLSLQNEERARELLGKVDENQEKWLKLFLDAYSRGEDFGIKEKVGELVGKYQRMKREEVAEMCLSEIGFTPQCKMEKNYSYLDLVITNDSGIVKEPGYSWGLGLLLLLTIDSYLRRLGKDP